MKIVFVRHGHPNYEKDCLTELGHEQAKAAAERLKDEKFDMIFSSSCGRAYETACHIAAFHGKEVQKLDFMREIDSCSQTFPTEIRTRICSSLLCE